MRLEARDVKRSAFVKPRLDLAVDFKCRSVLGRVKKGEYGQNVPTLDAVEHDEARPRYPNLVDLPFGNEATPLG